MAPAFGQRDREKESVDNYDVHVCLVKVCDNRVTKYVSIQTRERPGPARGKMVVRSEYGSSVRNETMEARIERAVHEMKFASTCRL